MHNLNIIQCTCTFSQNLLQILPEIEGRTVVYLQYSISFIYSSEKLKKTEIKPRLSNVGSLQVIIQCYYYVIETDQVMARAFFGMNKLGQVFLTLRSPYISG